MSDSADHKVTVTLPGGQCIDGQLLLRRRDPEGLWWYRVALDVPATAVEPVPGTDYSAVPTERMTAHRWILESLPADRPDRRMLTLHVGDCWAAKSSRLANRLVPTDDPATVATFLKEGWATPCPGCQPETPDA